MRIKDWSVVESPIGVSLRHVVSEKLGFGGVRNTLSRREICIAVVDGRMQISLHDSGIDEPLCEFYFDPNQYD